MKHLLLICFVCLCAYADAQDKPADTIPYKDTIIYATGKDSIEARFPGGITAWQNYLIAHIHATVAADHKARPGNYTVLLSFLVDTTGKVTQVEILQDPGYGTGDDARAVFEQSPAWIPAVQNGHKVIFRQRQMITYRVTRR